jgi:hypothetical protein
LLLEIFKECSQKKLINKKKGKKMFPGDFTVSEGHGHPLVNLIPNDKG